MNLSSAERARREFDSLVRQLSPALLRSAYLMCWDAAEAEDLLQETWVRVARQWPRVARMENPAGYVRRVLVNRVIDAATARSRRLSELRPDDSHLALHPDRRAAQALGAVEDQQQLIAALGALTARQRAVLVLRYWEDRSEHEVAGLLGCSEGSVKSTASRALSMLRMTRSVNELG